MSETLEPAIPDDLDERAERLMRTVCDRELSVATAESCTGGMLAALLTDIEGAGHGFDRGFVTYSADSKAELLGIDHGLLGENQAVTEAVARDGRGRAAAFERRHDACGDGVRGAGRRRA